MDGKLKPLSEAAADQHAKGLVSSSSRMDGRRAVSVYGSDTNWKNQILPADKTLCTGAATEPGRAVTLRASAWLRSARRPLPAALCHNLCAAWLTKRRLPRA